MPTNWVQLNSQCYGFIDNTQGKNISQKKYIYKEISPKAFVLALQQKQLASLLLVKGEPRTFPH